MSTHEDREDGGRFGWFVTAAGVVGDLGSPFYREERRRDVWNEASAVGLQAVLLLSLLAANGMVWLGGATGLPYAATLLAVVAVGAWLTILYAAALGVRVDDHAGLLRLRLVPYAVLLVVFFVGAARVAPSSGFLDGFVRGAVVGAAVAVAVLLSSGIRARRRLARGDA
jgi:hypothetical protein